MFYIKYTWSKELTPKENRRRNIIALKINFASWKRMCMRIIRNKIELVKEAYSGVTRSNFVLDQLIKLKLMVIKRKLKRTGREITGITKSPYTNSRYISYLYNDTHIKIRISDHYRTNKDNSTIFIYV